jgi:hypothetical protein
MPLNIIQTEKKPPLRGEVVLVAVVLFTLALMLLAATKIVWDKRQDELTARPYCGKVVLTFRTDAGYKTHPMVFVVIYSPRLGRNLCVRTNWTTYVNSPVGSTQCFTLTKSELNQ